MNNKKSSAPIIIILLILIISGGVGFYFWMNKTPKPETPQTTQQTPPTPNTPHTPTTYGTSALKSEKSEEELDETKTEEPQDQSTQPKFTITQANFDKVKEYIFSETDDKTLLPNNLPQEEKFEIEKIRTKLINDLTKQKSRWNPKIEENQKICDEHNAKIQEIKSQYPSLKSQKEQLEQQEKTKTAELNKLKYQRGEISPIYAKTLKKLSNIEIINPKTPNPELETKLKAEIKKLQDERHEIVGEIGNIKVKIGNLESKQRMYEGMLSNAIKEKDFLQQGYDSRKEEEKNHTISQLNSLYQITSTEG
ncbi:hypothetical protein [Candidatus Phytoplasma solani]|uniref:hypothetical protein n=1 Tax=Candidatus Phytoplasma solani TaxID=69896 RepID=UPI00358F23EE